MRRRTFIKTASGLLVPSLMSCVLRGSVPFPVGFWKPASPSGISAAAQAALNDWVTRVQGRGSDVTIAGTQTAVGLYIDGLMTDVVWDKLVRHSIYAGDSLDALEAPLKNGGPTAIDVLNNFVGGDYSQSTGLTGSTSDPKKYIDTDLPGNSVAGGMSDTSMHLSLYTRTGADAGVPLQMGGPPFMALAIDEGDQSAFYLNSGTSFIVVSDSNGIGHYIGSRISSSSADLYKAGSSIGSSGVAGGTRLAHEIFIHCQNLSGSPNAPTARTIEMYSVGLGLTSTDAANFTTRYATLRTALGR